MFSGKHGPSTSLYIPKHTSICVCICLCMCMLILYVYVHVYVYEHIHIQIYDMRIYIYIYAIHPNECGCDGCCKIPACHECCTQVQDSVVFEFWSGQHSLRDSAATLDSLEE